MAIDLLSIKPTTVERGLTGRTVMIYGAPKVGKTSFSAGFPKSLLMAFEKGYKNMVVSKQDMNTWSDFRIALAQLRKTEVKEMFQTIIIDTVDIAWGMAGEYVVSKKYADKDEIEDIEDVAFGAGTTKQSREFDKQMRAIVNLGYSLVLISHETSKNKKDETGEYAFIEPTAHKQAKLIASRMADIYGYAHSSTGEGGVFDSKLYIRSSKFFEAGSRLKYIDPVVDFTYNSLEAAVNKSIEKLEAEDGVVAVDYVRKEVEDSQKITLEQVFEQLTEVRGLLDLEDQEVVVACGNIVQEELGDNKKISDLKKGQEEVGLVIVERMRGLIKD